MKSKAFWAGGSSTLSERRKHEPLPGDRQARDIEGDEASVLEFRRDRVGRDEGDAETRHDALLDGFIAVEFHADRRRNLGGFEQALHQHAGAGADLTGQEDLRDQVIEGEPRARARAGDRPGATMTCG